MSWFFKLPQYPVSSLFDEFSARDKSAPLLIEAEPGAGKSTLIPLWLLRELQNNKDERIIYLVQPRILAAQSLAKRLASLTQTKLGDWVGYQVPQDNKTTKTTRLIVTTPGLLLQKVLNQPELAQVGCILLDEIHERSVNQDLLLAILQEAQLLNDSLELILMTATPDPKLQQAIGQRLYAAGFCYPVDVSYLAPALEKKSHYFERDELPRLVVKALHSVDAIEQQTSLIFLSGWNAIEHCFVAIKTEFPTLPIYRLHSKVDMQEQSCALNDALGPRIILSTNIAETSLTIKDISLVIDSGLMRRQVFDQKNAVSRLRTGRISQASADQRAGRAGRLQAGQCIRLWSKDERLAAADLPELRATDYLPIALKLAHWGAPVESLPWLEKPNELALRSAFEQLRIIGLVNFEFGITPAGIQASDVGTHPRIAHLLINTASATNPALILLVAISLHFEWQQGDDFSSWIKTAEQEYAKNIFWQKQAKRWVQQLNLSGADGRLAAAEVSANDGLIIAQAYADRIAVRQASGRYGLGSGAAFSAKLHSEYVCALVLRRQGEVLIAIAIAIELNDELKHKFSQRVSKPCFKNGRWNWQHQRLIGERVIDEHTSAWDEALAKAVVQLIQDKLVEQLKNHFFSEQLPPAAKKLLLKARLLNQYQVIEVSALDDATLVAKLPEWLAPFVEPTTSFDNIPWRPALEYYLGYELLESIEQALPDQVALPSGRNVSVEFNEAGEICVAAKLQEFFGCEELTLADSRLPIKISLLSPNGSPLAVTSNLKTFWKNGYPDVRKDMRGRYPRHPWPENPLEHQATALTKKRLQQQ